MPPKQVAVLFNILTCAVSAWVVFRPRPYGVAEVVAIVLPLVAIWLVATSEGNIHLVPKKGSREVNLAFGLFLPAIALTIRCASDYHLLNWKPAVELALMTGLVVGFVASRFETEDRRTVTTGILLMVGCSLYGFGAWLAINSIFDRAPAANYSAQVVGKVRTRSEDGTAYKFQLARWGPDQTASQVKVRRSLFEETRIGDVVCIDVNQGRLAMPYYAVKRCADR